jgi:hypothetical protein
MTCIPFGSVYFSNWILGTELAADAVCAWTLSVKAGAIIKAQRTKKAANFFMKLLMGNSYLYIRFSGAEILEHRLLLVKEQFCSHFLQNFLIAGKKNAAAASRHGLGWLRFVSPDQS